MKSNSKEVKTAVRAHLLERINLEDYQQENTPQNAYNIFLSEYGHNIKKEGEQTAFINWLRGGCIAINAEMNYNEVREILINEFKTNTPAKRDDEKSLNFYCYLLWVALKDMIQEPHKESERLLKKIARSFK